ncbi:Dynein family light intermediate chain [Trinorchestia longiramus]|nr:Dynein family light intermediate chain [Trinorchestia longiramus]
MASVRALPWRPPLTNILQVSPDRLQRNMVSKDSRPSTALSVVSIQQGNYETTEDHVNPAALQNHQFQFQDEVLTITQENLVEEDGLPEYLTLQQYEQNNIQEQENLHELDAQIPLDTPNEQAELLQEDERTETEGNLIPQQTDSTTNDALNIEDSNNDDNVHDESEAHSLDESNVDVRASSLNLQDSNSQEEELGIAHEKVDEEQEGEQNISPTELPLDEEQTLPEEEIVLADAVASSDMEGLDHHGWKKDEGFEMAGRTVRSSARRKSSGLPKNVTSVPEEVEGEEEEHQQVAGFDRRQYQEPVESTENEAIQSFSRRGSTARSRVLTPDTTQDLDVRSSRRGSVTSNASKSKVKSVEIHQDRRSSDVSATVVTSEQPATDKAQTKEREKDGQEDKLPKQSSLLLVGPKEAGKTTLMYQFLDRPEIPKPTLAIDYMYGRKAGRVSMVKDVVHLWELAGGTQHQLLATVISSCSLTSLAIIVVLDLSRPQHLYEELITIITLLRAQLADAIKKASIEDPTLSSRLMAAAWARVGRDHQDRERMNPLPVPLLVVGGKYDIFQDCEPDDKKVLCRAMRYVCHTNGAALQFFSARDPGLVKRAKEIMSHFAFNTAEVKSLAQDYNRPLIIPCGSDSLTSIGGGTDNPGGMSSEYWKNAILAKFPKTEEDKGPQTRFPDDPSRDPNYREADIDSLRAQKDQELERLCREAGRSSERYADLEL